MILAYSSLPGFAAIYMAAEVMVMRFSEFCERINGMRVHDKLFFVCMAVLIGAVCGALMFMITGCDTANRSTAFAQPPCECVDVDLRLALLECVDVESPDAWRECMLQKLGQVP